MYLRACVYYFFLNSGPDLNKKICVEYYFLLINFIEIYSNEIHIGTVNFCLKHLNLGIN